MMNEMDWLKESKEVSYRELKDFKVNKIVEKYKIEPTEED